MTTPTEHDAAIHVLARAFTLVNDALDHADFEDEERLVVEHDGILYALARIPARTAEGQAEQVRTLRLSLADANIRECNLAAHAPTMALVTAIVADVVAAHKEGPTAPSRASLIE